jgi:hypothetical protein
MVSGWRAACSVHNLGTRAPPRNVTPHPPTAMSRAFVKEDDGYVPPGSFALPPRDDPGFELAAARALLEAARDGNTPSAESATGFRWGEPRLHAHVRRLITEAEALPEEERDRRYLRVARRFIV